MKNQFTKSLSWLGLSEAGIRVTRLLTAVVLARVLDPITFGLAALVLTINELVHVFNRNGIGAKIIQCDERELEQTLNTAYRLGFLICGGLFLLQCGLAYPLAAAYQTPELVPMLQVLAIVYLMMPFGLIQSALVRRREEMSTVALINGVQVGTDNLLTALLALLGFGAWAIVLPKLLVAPIWVFGYRRAVAWRPTGPALKFDGAAEIINFGKFFLCIELLKTARLNLDNLIIARFLGVEALGLYYFARNAGLGFSLTLINAMTAALLPNLCAVSSNPQQLRERFVHNLKRISMIGIPLISLQAILAPIYVPLVFGLQWNDAIPILMLLCASAVLRPLGESASVLLLAQDKIQIDFLWNVIFTTLFVAVVMIAAQASLSAVAWAICLLYLVSQPLFLSVIWRRYLPCKAPSVTGVYV